MIFYLKRERYCQRSNIFVVLAKNQKELDDYRNHPGRFVVAKALDRMESKSISIDFKYWEEVF